MIRIKEWFYRAPLIFIDQVINVAFVCWFVYSEKYWLALLFVMISVWVENQRHKIDKGNK